MPLEYPNLYQYQHLIANRDNGAMLIVVMAIIIVAGFWNLRDVIQKWIPTIRDALIVLFYCTLIVATVEGLLGLKK